MKKMSTTTTAMTKKQDYAWFSLSISMAKSSRSVMKLLKACYNGFSQWFEIDVDDKSVFVYEQITKIYVNQTFVLARVGYRKICIILTLNRFHQMWFRYKMFLFPFFFFLSSFFLYVYLYLYIYISHIYWYLILRMWLS